MRRTMRLLAAVLVSAAAVTACTGTELGANDPANENVLTIGAAQPIKQLNPVTKANAWEQVLFSLIWNGLVKTKKDEKLAPDLATSWSPSADLRTWTFTLRTDVTFSNGKPLTPAAVVSTFDYSASRTPRRN